MTRSTTVAVMFAVIATGLPAYVSTAGEPPSLARKAEIFQVDMERRFLLEGQALCKLKPPRSNKPYIDYNMPD
ncbi:MAG TPA: hypothetical protein PKX28_09305, partial [Candidatus Hydrogenedentes bacterium]|nr:hypothetical protein [Candidatus Hydrogenedentota bacterium]